MTKCPSSQKGPLMISTLTGHVRRRGLVRIAAFGLVLSLSTAVWHDSAAAEGSVPAVTGLAQGAQGDAVRAVQQALLNQGIAVAGGVDGVFGAGTVSAVKQFQSRNGLNATGKVDDATALALGLTSNPLYGLPQGQSGDAGPQHEDRQ